MSSAPAETAGPTLPPVVAVATSAGGIAALRAVLGALPPTFPAAVLVVQHVEPTRANQLAHVLACATPPPVAQAAGGERPQAGHVYLAPPDRHLVLDADGRLALTDAPREHHTRPSAEPLFASVARHCGARCIAVVLTGMLDDGNRGVVLVKAAGGTVIAQDAGAQFAGMPRAAIASGAVDHVVPLDAVAPLLERLLTVHA